MVSAGYTPKGQAMPESDFFALGRTFVFLLTGKQPNEPAIFDSYNGQMRWRDFVQQISPKFDDLIDRMMAHSLSQRPANTREILNCLAEIEGTPEEVQRNSSGVPTEPVQKNTGQQTSQAKSQYQNHTAPPTPQLIIE
ncbi:hypothetical protein [Calothrix rhizosoleniae]|uniref:hypothetical protein n=1 Tax=Calothrix rhizosoleniae TaxID=888997 RepID=UPI000B4A1621